MTLDPISNSTLIDLNTLEGKVLAGAAISVLAFGILGGLFVSLWVTGVLPKFLEMKANLSIGQGILYIGVPVTGAAILVALATKFNYPKGF